MQNLCSKKVCKKYGKWCQKGAKMGAQIHPKKQKYWKKGMQKLIPKIDAEKELICAFMDPEMNDKGTKGGAPGGKEGKPPKAALRYLASFI